MIQNLLVLGINKYYGIAFPYCITFLLGKNKNSYFLKTYMYLFMCVQLGWGASVPQYSVVKVGGKPSPYVFWVYVRLLNLMISTFTTWVMLLAQSHHGGRVCVWGGGLAQPGILMWGNRHPKHYNGMRQMCAAALSIMSCCVEQSVLRILKVVFFFLLLVGSCSFHL